MKRSLLIVSEERSTADYLRFCLSSRLLLCSNRRAYSSLIFRSVPSASAPMSSLPESASSKISFFAMLADIRMVEQSAAVNQPSEGLSPELKSLLAICGSQNSCMPKCWYGEKSKRKAELGTKLFGKGP